MAESKISEPLLVEFFSTYSEECNQIFYKHKWLTPYLKEEEFQFYLEYYLLQFISIHKDLDKKIIFEKIKFIYESILVFIEKKVIGENSKYPVLEKYIFEFLKLDLKYWNERVFYSIINSIYNLFEEDYKFDISLVQKILELSNLNLSDEEFLESIIILNWTIGVSSIRAKAIDSIRKLNSKATDFFFGNEEQKNRFLKESNPLVNLKAELVLFKLKQFSGYFLLNGKFRSIPELAIINNNVIIRDNNFYYLFYVDAFGMSLERISFDFDLFEFNRKLVSNSNFNKLKKLIPLEMQKSLYSILETDYVIYFTLKDSYSVYVQAKQ
jgi:hypothetical protein